MNEKDGAAGAPEVINGIQSLHDRIDELHRLVAQRLEAEGMHAGAWLHEHSGVVHPRPGLPAWRRRTEGELRWPVAVTTAAAKTGSVEKRGSASYLPGRHHPPIREEHHVRNVVARRRSRVR